MRHETGLFCDRCKKVFTAPEGKNHRCSPHQDQGTSGESNMWWNAKLAARARYYKDNFGDGELGWLTLKDALEVFNECLSLAEARGREETRAERAKERKAWENHLRWICQTVHQAYGHDGEPGVCCRGVCSNLNLINPTA